MTTKNKCKRCGQCCERLGIGCSPKELKDAYLRWRCGDDEKKQRKLGVQNARNLGDIFLIYPMLVYLGKSKVAKNWYMYRCKHFARDKNGKGKCTIHGIKPDMCADFPYYNKVYNVRIGQAAENPTTYKGCGYNQ